MTCLICRYFQPTEPPQHKLDREAGRCESHCGKEWDHHTAIRYIKNHGGQIDGWCRRHPEAKQVKHGHFCGDISVYDYFYNHHWAVEPIEPRQGLFDWAQEALSTVLHGSARANWSVRRNKRLEEQNVELRRQLKQARKISMSRLERLQKNKPKPEQPAEPFRPRLIAAE